MHCHKITNAISEQKWVQMEIRTFETVDISKIGKDTIVFGLRFMDQIKPANNGVCYKIRLFALSYGGNQAPTIVIKAATAHWLTPRFIFSIADSLWYTGNYT